MKDEQIKYRKGYKYQLAEDYITEFDIFGFDIETQFIVFTFDGGCIFRSGYAWDGASGTTIDTKSSMRATLEHDGLYQLIRMSLLPDRYRRYADDRLKATCIKDGMWKLRAGIWYRVVRKLAAFAANQKNKKKVFTAGKRK